MGERRARGSWGAGSGNGCCLGTARKQNTPSLDLRDAAEAVLRCKLWSTEVPLVTMRRSLKAMIFSPRSLGKEKNWEQNEWDGSPAGGREKLPQVRKCFMGEDEAHRLWSLKRTRGSLSALPGPWSQGEASGSAFRSEVGLAIWKRGAGGNALSSAWFQRTVVQSHRGRVRVPGLWTLGLGTLKHPAEARSCGWQVASYTPRTKWLAEKSLLKSTCSSCQLSC